MTFLPPALRSLWKIATRSYVGIADAEVAVRAGGSRRQPINDQTWSTDDGMSMPTRFVGIKPLNQEATSVP